MTLASIDKRLKHKGYSVRWPRHTHAQGEHHMRRCFDLPLTTPSRQASRPSPVLPPSPPPARESHANRRPPPMPCQRSVAWTGPPIHPGSHTQPGFRTQVSRPPLLADPPLTTRACARPHPIPPPALTPPRRPHSPLPVTLSRLPSARLNQPTGPLQARQCRLARSTYTRWGSKPSPGPQPR